MVNRWGEQWAQREDVLHPFPLLGLMHLFYLTIPQLYPFIINRSSNKYKGQGKKCPTVKWQKIRHQNVNYLRLLGGGTFKNHQVEHMATWAPLCFTGESPLIIILSHLFQKLQWVFCVVHDENSIQKWLLLKIMWFFPKKLISNTLSYYFYKYPFKSH